MKVVLLTVFLTVFNMVTVDGAEPWTSLKVKWELSLSDLINLPRTVAAAQAEKFELKDNQCEKSGGFLGQRFWKGNDPAIILLFDVNGNIAGIQTAVPHSKFIPAEPLQGKFYLNDGGEYWTQTAYFVNPDTICDQTKARTKVDFTGTGLFIQRGQNPITDSMNVPLEETGLEGTEWASGACIPTLGQHYWIWTLNMSCDNLAPNCLLYNYGKLNGFCFIKNVVAESPNGYYGYIIPDKLKKVIQFPNCMLEEDSYKNVTALHVFFNEHPRMSPCADKFVEAVKNTGYDALNAVGTALYNFLTKNANA